MLLLHLLLLLPLIAVLIFFTGLTQMLTITNLKNFAVKFFSIVIFILFLFVVCFVCFVLPILLFSIATYTSFKTGNLSSEFFFSNFTIKKNPFNLEVVTLVSNLVFKQGFEGIGNGIVDTFSTAKHALAIPNLGIDGANLDNMDVTRDIHLYKKGNKYEVGSGVGAGILPGGGHNGGPGIGANEQGFVPEYPTQGPHDFVSSHPNRGVNISNHIVSIGWSHDKSSNLYILDDSNLCETSNLPATRNEPLSPRVLGFHGTRQAGVSHQPYATNLANALDHAKSRFKSATSSSYPHFDKRD